MSVRKVFRVAVGDSVRSYPAGTSFRQIAGDFQGEDDILLVYQDRRLMELSETLDRDCTMTMVTARDRQGMLAYERSLVFLMLKAFYDVVGRDSIERIHVDFSISRTLFCRLQGAHTVDQPLLDKVKSRMQEIADKAIPIQKLTMRTDDVIELFRAVCMPDKAKLLQYRVNAHTDIYALEDFYDFFYGYMVPDTGYLRVFGLELFDAGFILRMPSHHDPHVLAPFEPSYKVFREMFRVQEKAERLGVSNVGDLDSAISADHATGMILAAEAMMEKRIGDIAQQIAEKPDIRFVMIAGPSSSGKTTFSHRLSTQLRAFGLQPHPIATDNYFVDRDRTPLDENGDYDFECIEAMDVEQFNRDMVRLLNGETVELPRFNFKKGAREYVGDYMTLGPQDILVIEGIHCLNDAFTYSLPAESKYKIYISCLTTLNVDDHNRIPTTDARLMRRIQRDARARGYSAQMTIQMWPSVRRGEERNIFPYQDSADTVFNSALLYETSVLRPYLEPLLFSVPQDSPAYSEARRLLKFLSGFLPISADNVPKTSLVREFIGGGCYEG